MPPQKPPLALAGVGGDIPPILFGFAFPSWGRGDVVVPPLLSPGLGGGPSHVAGLKMAFLRPLGPKLFWVEAQHPQRVLSTPSKPPQNSWGQRHKKVTWLGRLGTKVAAVRAEGKPWGAFKVRGAMVKYYLKKLIIIIKKSKFKNPTEIKSGSHLEEWILSQHV